MASLVGAYQTGDSVKPWPLWRDALGVFPQAHDAPLVTNTHCVAGPSGCYGHVTLDLVVRVFGLLFHAGQTRWRWESLRFTPTAHDQPITVVVSIDAAGWTEAFGAWGTLSQSR